jgi:polyisoprenoid-binding protein YceI
MRLGLLLTILLGASTARADEAWAVDPDQALLTVDAALFSAFSHRVTGRLEDREDGTIRVELRMPLDSLTTGSAIQDRHVPREGELLFELTGTGVQKNGALDLGGTLTLFGVTRPVRVKLGLARIDATAFGHAVIVVHLRDFGVALPAGMRDAARIELDTGLRLERALASNG